SNLVRAKKIKDLKYDLIIASKLPLDDSIIIYENYFKNISNANYSKNEIENVLLCLGSNFNAILNSFSIIDSMSKIHESIKSFDPNDFNIQNNSIIIKEAERTKAISIFKEWIIEEADDFLYVVDPYFDIKDAELLNIIHKCDKNLRSEEHTSELQSRENL